MTCTCSSTPPFMARGWRSCWKTWWRRSLPMEAWSGYWKTGARRSPATISITLTGATTPRRSLRFWRNYGPTPIYKQGECHGGRHDPRNLVAEQLGVGEGVSIAVESFFADNDAVELVQAQLLNQFVA